LQAVLNITTVTVDQNVVLRYIQTCGLLQFLSCYQFNSLCVTAI